MEGPVFLEVEEVLEIHRDQVARYGGSTGLRDLNLLESAVNAPAATFNSQPLHHDLFEMAAAYMLGLILNHAFVDGSKRVGVAAALVFLDMNGVSIRYDEPAFGDLAIAVARSEADKSAIVEFFKSHAPK